MKAIRFVLISLSLPAVPAPTSASSVASFGSTNSPIPPSPISPSPNVLWGAAAMAAIGAATGWALEAQRKRKEEEARARAEAAAANARAEAREAEERRRQAEAAWRRKQEEQAQEVSMPPNLPPEAQQAFLHGGPGAQAWIAAHAEELRRQQNQQRAAAQTHLRWDERQREALQAYRPQMKQTDYEALRHTMPAYQAAQKKPWWQRAWNAVTHPVQTFENALFQWGAHSQTGYQVIRGLANLTASMDDEQRNPVTAAFGKALRNGIAGFTYGVQSTWTLASKTASSLIHGNWGDARRYGNALLEGVVKGWIWGGIQTAAHLSWGAIKTVTPIGLFETGPTWWNAIKDARAGKRGGWDVALTSLFLMANVIGIAGAVNGVQTQVTRTALIREYGEPVRLLLAEKEVIPLLKNGELAPKPWTEYVPLKYQKDVIPAFEGQSAVAVKLNDMITVYRYWGGESPENGPWVTVYRKLSPSQARSLLALPNNNPAINITEFGIPKDVVVIVGKAANKSSAEWAGPYAIGGGIQIYVPDPFVLLRFP